MVYTEIVCFKSEDKFFRKERDGIKPNTIRIQQVDINRDFDEERRFEKLDAFMNGKTNSLNIEIENVQTGDRFERSVKDVSKWNDIYIISWTHPSQT